MQDSSLYEKALRIENKSVFVDLKTNRAGTYLKITEREDGHRNSIIIPSSGIMQLTEALQEAMSQADGSGGRQSQGTRR